MAEKNFEEILEKIRRGEKLDTPEDYNDVANYFYEKDDINLVTEVLTIAKDHENISPRGFYNLGINKYNAGKEEEAINIWNEALNKEMYTPATFHALAVLNENPGEKLNILRTAREKDFMDEEVYFQLILNAPVEEKISLAQEAIEKDMTSNIAFDYAMYGAETKEEKLVLSERAIKEDKFSRDIISANIQFLYDDKDKKLDERIFEAIKRFGDEELDPENNVFYADVIAAAYLEGDAKRVVEVLGPHRAEEMSEHGLSLLMRQYGELNQPEEVVKMIGERFDSGLLTSKMTAIAQYFFSKDKDYENSIAVAEIGLKLKDVDGSVLQLLMMDYNVTSQHQKGFEITTRLLEEGSDDTLTHHYHAKHAYHLKKYREGLKHSLIIKDREELGIEKVQVLTLNAMMLPNNDELHRIVKSVVPQLTEIDILNYETTTGRDLIEGHLEKAIKENKLNVAQYSFMMNRAIDNKDMKKAYSIIELARNNNKLEYPLASIFGVSAIEHKMFDKVIELLEPFEKEWAVADSFGYVLSLQEKNDKEKAKVFGEKIKNGSFKGEYDSNVLHILHGLTEDKAFFDLIKKYSEDNPNIAEPLGSLLVISSKENYELDTKKTTMQLLDVVKNNNLISKMKELESGTSTVKSFDQTPLKNTIFVKEKDEPHTEEIKYRNQKEHALKKHNILARVPDFIGEYQTDNKFNYVTSFEQGIMYTDILDVKLTKMDFADALLKYDYMDWGLLKIQSIILDAIAATYVEMPETNLPVYNFRQKFLDKGYDTIVVDAFEEHIDFLDNSPHMCYFGDTWSDNILIGSGGIVLPDTENRGRMPISVEVAHFMAHRGQGDVKNALSAGNFVMERINEYGQETGRIIEDKERYSQEYLIGTLVRSALNARSRGQIEKRFDTAYYIATSGIEMLDLMKEKDLISADKNTNIIEDVLKSEQETYKQLFWKQMDEDNTTGYKPKPEEKEMYEQMMAGAKKHRISDPGPRIDLMFKSLLSGFLSINGFPNKEFANKVKAYVDKE